MHIELCLTFTRMLVFRPQRANFDTSQLVVLTIYPAVEGSVPLKTVRHPTGLPAARNLASLYAAKRSILGCCQHSIRKVLSGHENVLVLTDRITAHVSGESPLCFSTAISICILKSWGTSAGSTVQ